MTQTAEKIEEITLNSRFGPITYTEESIISFPQGLFGFGSLKDFVIAKAPKSPLGEFILLQCTEDESVTFLLHPVLTEGGPISQDAIATACEALDLEKEDTSVLSIVSIHRENEDVEVTTNLRAPLFICAKERRGYQYILQDNSYAIRHPLKS